jgi:hypothetical protein
LAKLGAAALGIVVLGAELLRGEARGADAIGAETVGADTLAEAALFAATVSMIGSGGLLSSDREAVAPIRIAKSRLCYINTIAFVTAANVYA